MPQLASFQVVVQQEEIKDRAAPLPRMTVPAEATSKFRFIHLERRVTIPPIGMMPAKRTAAHPATIKLDIATNKHLWVLLGVPVPNGARCLEVRAVRSVF